MPDPLQRRQAENVSQGPTQYKQRPYKLNTVHVGILLNEVIDVPVLHPF